MAHGTAIRADGQLADNLIPEDDHSFALSTGSWTSPNAVLSIEYNDTVSAGYNTLKISPSTLGPVTVTFNPIRSTLNDRNDNMVFHCRIKSDRDLLVSVQVARGAEGSTTRQVAVPSGRWNILRSQPIQVPFTSETYLFTTTLTFSNHNGSPILLTVPVVHRDLAFTDNLFVREMVPLMPDVFTSIDAVQEYPTYPMYRLLEVGLAYGGVGSDQFDHFRYRDISEGRIDSDPFTFSGFVSPIVAERRFLPWLAQFNGVPLLDPVIGTTPWGNLPGTWAEIMQSIDPTADVVLTISSITRSSNVVSAVVLESVASISAGHTVSVSLAGSFNGQFLVTSVDVGTSTIQWAQDGTNQTASAGVIKKVDTEWIELEAFETDVTGIDEYLRWQVETGYYGVKAGSREAIVQAAKQVLTGTKTVNVYSNWQGNSWVIKVYTKTAETPDGVEGASSSRVLTAIERARPAGYQILHEANIAAADSSFVLGDPVNGVLGVSRL